MNHTGRRLGVRPVAAASNGASGKTRRALYSADPVMPEFMLSNPLISPRALRQRVSSIDSMLPRPTLGIGHPSGS
ncbi:hypothetical protein G9444_3003 [Rhodococcus erythropolis]|uniref:Uncharacterized protein n=1 Tax=Rhodococcus erythropolis TaxID=1833 RepID=A0A6G9CTN9_RHOER|nr:hypothetical protein G418_19861 [Rhodococcus qingshengii BKS 20-40]QIP40248.1 hypothetical protein G9444_3003 [Rhodococcus erythropolis]